MDITAIRAANLRTLLTASGLTAEKFAVFAETSSSYLSQILSPNDKRGMGDRLARKIERKCRKEHGWMDQRHDLQIVVGAQNHKNTEPGPPIRGAYPLISWVQAGDWREAMDSFQPGDGEEWFRCPANCGPNSYVLRVQGSSMEPKFRDGELIFVDPDAEAMNRSFVVVRMDDDNSATFKQLIIEGDRRYLRPLNERWPDPIIEVKGNATICGVVVFKGEIV